MDECRIQPVSGCRPNSDCCWYPVDVTSDNGRQMRLCCDQSGCCGMFPEDCRNTFWPDFAHPRWLCWQGPLLREEKVRLLTSRSRDRAAVQNIKKVRSNPLRTFFIALQPYGRPDY